MKQRKLIQEMKKAFDKIERLKAEVTQERELRRHVTQQQADAIVNLSRLIDTERAQRYAQVKYAFIAGCERMDGYACQDLPDFNIWFDAWFNEQLEKANVQKNA